MEEKKKVSEITTEDLASYCKIDEPDENDKKFLAVAKGIAESFIADYTGLNDLDSINTFVLVVYVLVQDMYDNRALYVDKKNLNKMVSTILGMHDYNLI